MTKRFWKTDRSIYHWKKQWNLKKQQDIPPLKIPKFYLENGYEIIDSENPGNPNSNSIKVYDMANPYVPPPINWINLFKESKPLPDKRSFLYSPNIQLTEGIPQAQWLTNSIVFQNIDAPNIITFDGLKNDEKYQHFFSNQETNLNLEMVLKNIIYQSKKWHTKFEYVDPIIKDKFRLKYPKIKSIPWNLTSKVFGKHLLNLCEAFGACNMDCLDCVAFNNHTLNSFITNVRVGGRAELEAARREDISFTLHVEGTTTYAVLGCQPLAPFVESNEVGSLSLAHKMPEIWPIMPHLDLIKNSVFNYRTLIPFGIQPDADITKQLIYPHFLFDVNETKDWDIGQYIAKGMLIAYGHLNTLAHTLFGADVAGNLKYPLCLNYVGCNGQKVAYVSFQLNSLPSKNSSANEDPLYKNIAWVHTDDASSLIYRNYNLENSEIEDYNPKCLEKLFSFYLYGTDS